MLTSIPLYGQMDHIFNIYSPVGNLGCFDFIAYCVQQQGLIFEEAIS